MHLSFSHFSYNYYPVFRIKLYLIFSVHSLWRQVQGWQERVAVEGAYCWRKVGGLWRDMLILIMIVWIGSHFCYCSSNEIMESCHLLFFFLSSELILLFNNIKSSLPSNWFTLKPIYKICLPMLYPLSLSLICSVLFPFFPSHPVDRIALEGAGRWNASIQGILIFVC